MDSLSMFVLINHLTNTLRSLLLFQGATYLHHQNGHTQLHATPKGLRKFKLSQQNIQSVSLV